MSQTYQKNLQSDSDEISAKDLFLKLKSFVGYVKERWKLVLVIAIICSVLGLVYAIKKKPTYVGICTFVLEDSKSGASGMMGQFGGLASLAGINIGGSGGGIFEGDNILELYKSRSMLKKTLLTSCDFDGKKQLLIDRFLHFGNPKPVEGAKQITFEGDPEKFNRDQDSVITGLVGLFNKKILQVDKPDKKLDIISVRVVTPDELFSKYFTETLVKNVNDFYIQTKTKKSFQNVQILQRQMDSVRSILNYSINSVASANDSAPNANPQLSFLRVPSQKKQVDVQANTAIYSQMVQNLELAKIAVRQETPLIQIIDEPILPLPKNVLSKTTAGVLGLLLGFFLAIFILMVQKLYRKMIQ